MEICLDALYEGMSLISKDANLAREFGGRRQHHFGRTLGILLCFNSTMLFTHSLLEVTTLEPPLGPRGHTAPPPLRQPSESRRPSALPALSPCLGAPGGLVLMGLQLLRQGLPKALVFDALQQRRGQKRLQAPFLPSRQERGLVRKARRISLFPPALQGSLG